MINIVKNIKLKTSDLLLISLIFLSIFSGIGIYIFSPKIPFPNVATGTPVIQSQIIPGQDVKWSMLVEKSQIEGGRYLVQLPKDATVNKVEMISEQQAKDFFITKPLPKLSLSERQKISAIPVRQHKGSLSIFGEINSFFEYIYSGIDNIFSFLFGDLGDVLSNILKSIMGDNSASKPIIQTRQAVYVNVLAQLGSLEGSIIPTIETSSAPTPEVTPTVPTIPEPATPTATTENTVVTTPSTEVPTTPTTPETPITPAENPTPAPVTPIVYVAVEYTTPAPQIVSEITDRGQQVTVSSVTEDPQAPLVDVLASTKIPEIFKVGQKDQIQIKWQNQGNQEVVFKAYDTDNNGKLDYVEWTVPHLSTQTFDIIFISKAFQLDAQQNIIADIYNTVKDQDGNYVTITDGQYIRATFLNSLSSKNDNTIFAKATNPAASATIEVYPAYIDENGNITEGPKVATFENVKDAKTYKVLLTSLQTPTDIFDLRVLGSVDIDYIVDPTCTQNSDCSGGTPFCDTSTGTCTDGTDGYGCLQGTECVSGICNSASQCGYIPIGNVCSLGADCATGVCDYQCIGAKIDGDTCSQFFECASEVCNSGGTCGRLADGNSCSSGNDCIGGFCNGRYICGTLSDGNNCTQDSDCTSGACFNATCGLVGNGGNCSYDGMCSGGFCNSFGACGVKIPDGQGFCGNYIDCTNGFCNSQGVCGYVSDGGSCGNSSDCSSNFCNSYGVCGYIFDGGACNNAGDCSSNFCNSQSICGYIADGNSCSSAGDCSSGICSLQGFCGAVSNGSACRNSGECGSGNCSSTCPNCGGQSWCLGTSSYGASCGGWWDCASAWCNTSAGSCTNGALGDGCNPSRSDECVYGTVCSSGGICSKFSDGSVCSSNNDCSSNFCNSQFLCSPATLYFKNVSGDSAWENSSNWFTDAATINSAGVAPWLVDDQYKDFNLSPSDSAVASGEYPNIGYIDPSVTIGDGFVITGNCNIPLMGIGGTIFGGTFSGGNLVNNGYINGGVFSGDYLVNFANIAGGTFSGNYVGNYGTIDMTGDNYGPPMITGSSFNNGGTIICPSGKAWSVNQCVNILISSIAVSGAGSATTVINGQTLQMLASILPSNAMNQTVIWSKTNGTGTATINSSGLITATGVGTVTVRATANDGSAVFGESQITVTTPNIAVTGVTLNESLSSILVGEAHQFVDTIAPANATNSSVTWSSSNIAIATVDSLGLVTGVSAGTAIITVSTVDGNHTASATVTVNAVQTTTGGGGIPTPPPATIVQSQPIPAAVINYISNSIEQIRQSILKLFGINNIAPAKPTTQPPTNLQPTQPPTQPPTQSQITSNQQEGISIYKKILGVLNSILNFFTGK
jgi:uncharacterized protein YjdB